MIYKLTYLVGADSNKQEVFAHNEIALASALLEMERNVGLLCHGVRIEKCDQPDNYHRTTQLDNLQHIRRCANVLEDHMRQDLKLPKRKKD
jgi:hypothetical protein